MHNSIGKKQGSYDFTINRRSNPNKLKLQI